MPGDDCRDDAGRTDDNQAYLGIDHDTLWSIVITDVPALLPMLRAIRQIPR